MGMSVLGGGGIRSARKEPPAIRRLMKIFSLMDIHIGENLRVTVAPVHLGLMRSVLKLTPGNTPSDESINRDLV